MASWYNSKFSTPSTYFGKDHTQSPQTTSNLQMQEMEPHVNQPLSYPLSVAPPVGCPSLHPPPLPFMHQPYFPPANFSLPPPNFPTPSMNMNIQGNDKKCAFDRLKESLEQRHRSTSKQKETRPHLKISTIKQKLTASSSLITRLEGQINCLQITSKNLSEEEWVLRSKDAQNTKAELEKLTLELQNPNFQLEIMKAVNNRRKKREYRKRKAKEWQEHKREANLYAEEETRRIDTWLDKMKDQVERAKRAEDIKREADLVLSDVTLKKAEAKRMLNLLNTLSKLRASRAQSSGNSQESTENNAFTQIIDRLKKMWLKQFNGYKMEEEGLKVMLDHREEERASVEAAQFRKNLKSWAQGIFGSSRATLPQTYEEFIETRRDWDRFVRAEDTPMSSRIPVGWVLPCEPSSQQWANLIK